MQATLKTAKPLRHILSVSQFNRKNLDELFELTESIKLAPGSFSSRLIGKHMTAIFYEPSTRTYASFSAAMLRLGGQVTPITGVEYSSVAKGETFEDTILTLAQYSDALVLRHPEIGSAAAAAKISPVPIINAGDGAGEHPTQALLDIYTIISEQGSIDNKTITLVGDLKHGRTVHSLVHLLANYSNVTLNYVSPGILKMPKEIVAQLDNAGVQQNQYDNLETVIGSSDVVYMTRVQKERFENPKDYESVKDSLVIDAGLMTKAKQSMTLMHPLPRVGEISPAVDSDPRAAYFRQVENGMYVRMALLLGIMEAPHFNVQG